jgi:hypothetical protein
MSAETSLCRYCFSEAEPMNPLWSVCRCKGSIEWMHRNCQLQRMVSCQNNGLACEVCKTPYDNVTRRELRPQLQWKVLLEIVMPGVYFLLSFAELGHILWTRGFESQLSTFFVPLLGSTLCGPLFVWAFLSTRKDVYKSSCEVALRPPTQSSRIRLCTDTARPEAPT